MKKAGGERCCLYPPLDRVSNHLNGGREGVRGQQRASLPHAGPPGAQAAFAGASREGPPGLGPGQCLCSTMVHGITTTQEVALHQLCLSAEETEA